MRIRRLFSILLSLSLLLSAIGPLLLTDCPLLSDRSPHAPAEHHSVGAHPHSLTGEYSLPCASNRDTTPSKPIPCPQQFVPCCVFHVVPATKIEAVLFESARIASDELILPHLPETLVQVDFRTSWLRSLSSPQYSGDFPGSSDRQAFLGIFLI